MKLNAVKIRNLTTPGKHADGGGLYLEITKTGSKLWRHQYRFNGKQQLLSLGKYPAVTLVQARELHTEQKAQLAQGLNPSDLRKRSADNTFQAVADRWYEINQTKWVASVQKRTRFRLQKDILPVIGHYPVGDITPPIVLDCLRRIEARGVGETVRRCKTFIGMIMRFAIAEGYAERDPTADLRGVLKPQPKPLHRPAVATTQGVKSLLGNVVAGGGNRACRGVVLTAILTLQRNSEIRFMKWSDIQDGVWQNHITKTDVTLSVPLPTQLQEALEGLRGWDDTYVFAGNGKSGVISEAAPLNYMRQIGIDTKTQTLHGFRASGRTLLVEELEYPDNWVEHQLAHMPRAVHGRAYDRAKFLKQRTAMMQHYADWLYEG